MAFPATAASVPSAFNQVVAVIASVKAGAQQYLVQLQGNVDTAAIFRMVDDLQHNNAVIVALGSTTGLAAYATANIPNYSGNFINDGSAVVTAINNVIAWVVANFPADTGGFLQAYKINADGSRTATVFTPAQTAPLTTLLQTLVGTIG